MVENPTVLRFFFVARYFVIRTIDVFPIFTRHNDALSKQTVIAKLFYKRIPGSARPAEAPVAIRADACPDVVNCFLRLNASESFALHQFVLHLLSQYLYPSTRKRNTHKIPSEIFLLPTPIFMTNSIALRRLNNSTNLWSLLREQSNSHTRCEVHSSLLTSRHPIFISKLMNPVWCQTEVAVRLARKVQTLKIYIWILTVFNPRKTHMSSNQTIGPW